MKYGPALGKVAVDEQSVFTSSMNFVESGWRVIVFGHFLDTESSRRRRTYILPSSSYYVLGFCMSCLSVCLSVCGSTFAMLFEALDGSGASLPGALYSGFGGTLDSLERFCTQI